MCVHSHQDWRTLHKAWQPLFSPGSLSCYLGLMEDSAIKLTKRLEASAASSAGAHASAGGSRINISEELGLMTLQVSGRQW